MKKIKLLFLHWCLVCGGAENALYDLVTLLDKEKFDVTVFTLFEGGEFETKFKEAGITLISPYSCIKARKTIFGKIYNRYKGKQIAHAIQNIQDDFLRICRIGDYDLTIVYHLDTKWKKISQGINGKKVCYIHGDVETNSNIQQELEQGLYRWFDKTICVSKRTYEGCKKYASESYFLQCYNPIDVEKIVYLANEQCKLPEKYICAVGRLVKVKGFERLISSFKYLIDNEVDMKLVIVGEGEERSNLEALISQLHLQNYVELVGYKTNPYPYIKNAYCMVNTSYTEGMPVTAMESLVLGTPIVSMFSGVAELIESSRAGIVVETEKELQDELYKMSTDSKYYEEVKNDAIKQGGCLKNIVNVSKIEEIYENIVGSK